MNVETFAEQKSRNEPENFFSPAMRNEKPQKPKSSEGSTRKTADGEKVATSSLISVYEVTTLAVKNREAQDGWKPPVPWWSAVAFGFLVSVIAAWAVLLFLKKKKQRETVSTNKTGDKEQGLVDPLLKPSDASEHESSRVSDNSRM
ncbi:unnamed protein product [Heligmosomoides polygyrus]|uniref:Transmembrane protein n=1 Tax=Heligmosomoides polygyrus TaxID=6339 RepID=A0A183G783_HELPZ|nr:unnamed protein product [Heligmosomoides polygyrus]